MKIICSGITSCNNCSNSKNSNYSTECNNNCCNNQICTYVAGKNECVNIKINKNLFDSKFDCVLKCHIVSSILVSTHLFVFVQVDFDTENNSLYVVTAEVNIQTLTTIDDTIQLQLIYNLFVLGKTNCLKSERAQKLKIKQVVYNKYSDIFVILFRNKSKTLIGTIDYLEAIYSLNTNIELLKNQQCNILIINDPPECIDILSKCQYKVLVYDECNKHSKGYIIMIE